MAAKAATKIDTTLKKGKKPNRKGKDPGKNYSLIRAIRGEKIYKDNVKRRDKVARKTINEGTEISGPSDAMPGQLISFNYLTPKTAEELKYYDAMPVTIFFGIFNTKEGKRIMGFNIHYYPPRIRFQVMDRIMEIWKPMYLKAWETGLDKDLVHFDYRWLQMQLENAGLGFGVRMYIPELTGNVRVVPPKLWSKAVYSEGVFKKQTRYFILKYWAEYRKKTKS